MKPSQRLTTCALLASLLNPWSVSLAQQSLDADSQRLLNLLEQKYFGRTYESDSDERREARLEKLVFGDVLSGDSKQRINRLAASTANLEPVAASQPEAQAPTAPTTATTTQTPAATYQDATDEEYKGSESDSYPRVTALENAILGQSHAEEKLQARLARMESKAFGAASSKSSFGDRTDALEQYAEQKLHKKLFPEDPDNEIADDSSAPNATSAGSGQYPRITALEQAILGKTNTTQELPARLAQMETKAFGKSSSNPDLSQRTEALEGYAEKTLHKKPLLPKNNTAAATTSQGSRIPAQLLSMVGTSLLGMTGFGGLGALPLMAPALVSRMNQSSASGNKSSSDLTEQPVSTRPEDPVIESSDPPPPTAKLITKVGWCEVQLFGQTYTSMHLAERLGQLNRTLHYKPGKTGINLMDDIGGLIQAVLDQRKPEQSIGSNPPPQVQ